MAKINAAIFWENVRDIRENKGWTQKYVAEKLEMNLKSYSAKELGRQSTVLRSLAMKVAEVLGTTVEALSTGTVTEKPQHPYTPFFESVKKCREDAGWTLGDMANMLGMSKSNYAKKEQCDFTKHPSRALLTKIAEIFGTTVDNLMGKPDKDFNVRRGIALKLIEAYKDNPDRYEEYIMKAMTDGVISQNSQGKFMLSKKYTNPAPLNDQRKVDAVVGRLSKIMNAWRE